jgi:hypothetical protein
VKSDAQLLEIVSALGASGRFPGRLYGGQEQGDQDGDDRDDHEQFDEREAIPEAGRRIEHSGGTDGVPYFRFCATHVSSWQFR